MVNVDGSCNYRQTHSPSRLAWSESWRPHGTQSAFIKWTKLTLIMALSRDDKTINIVVVIIIIINQSECVYKHHNMALICTSQYTTCRTILCHCTCSLYVRHDSKIKWWQTVCESSAGTGIPHGILVRDRDTDRSGRPRDMYWRNGISKCSGEITTMTFTTHSQL